MASIYLIPLPIAAASGISGTLAATEAADVASFAANLVDTGTLSVSDAADAASFVGSAVVTGTLGATDSKDIANFLGGGVAISGTLTVADAADVAALVGTTSVINGVLAATEAADEADFAVQTPVTWPSDVNQEALVGTYSEKADNNLLIFTPEVGPPKQHRKFSVSSDLVTFDQIITATEYASFLAFYRTTLKDGTLSFVRERPRTHDNESFMFAAVPSIAHVGNDLYHLTLSMKSAPQ